jgi:hypothetical protein
MGEANLLASKGKRAAKRRAGIRKKGQHRFEDESQAWRGVMSRIFHTGIRNMGNASHWLDATGHRAVPLAARDKSNVVSSASFSSSF